MFYSRDQLGEGIALSLNFQALLYLLSSFIQQHMLNRVYCMPGTLQGLRAEKIKKINTDVPASVFKSLDRYQHVN